MRTLPSGQYLPGHSFLHQLDARTKLLCLFLLMAAIIGTSSLRGYALGLVVIATLIMLSGLPLRYAVASVRHVFWFLLVIWLMNALFYDGEGVLASWGIFQLSRGGIRQGFRVVSNVVLILILGNLLTMTTLPTQVTTALESLIKPLKLIGVPTEEVAMIISVAIQFIPTLMEETEQIKMAQIARGARFESKKLAERAASFLPLVVPIFIAAFRRAEELALAMEARGYRNAKNRTKRKQEPLAAYDYGAIMVCVLICLLQFSLRW
ncbi:MAG: energy-coupling factor transporter transmembrane protein EcfT [Firmicutes bacterium]|nr:energy-coupling factor transporter transmembrane protein EcfT [Bacillota bacterium]